VSLDVYLYGMTVLSTIHRLAGALPHDGYAEIAETRVCPGGETMNAAMLLSGLGLRCAIGGPHWGTETRDVLTRYAERYDIDSSGIAFDAAYPGVRDVVLVASGHRSVLGSFGKYFSEQPGRWGEPDATAIERARVVAIDPFFGESSERAAKFARRAAKPYVTIDCAFDSALHRGAAATVVSREYRLQHHQGAHDEALLRQYADESPGLSIFTSGKEAIRYARRDSAIHTAFPCEVPVTSTLGAGDTFRAGIVYGLVRGLSDDACVRFAAGLAALLCTRFPIADSVPSLDEVQAFMLRRSEPM
jgi:sugar/nucleoside kinase (ribokinase family)